MTASAQDFENLFEQWDAALVGSRNATDNEGAVVKFANDLLRLLGWADACLALNEQIKIRVGCGPADVKPDVVIASSKDDTKQPGKVYAVIELKRRGLADEDARRQAQSYADPLHAPVYAVIDGERIQVWHRRIVEADKQELNLPRAEFQTRFDEVCALLGREQLTRLHEDLRTRDEVDEARKRVANLDHNVKLVRLALRDGKVWCDQPAAEFFLAERWWGSPVSLNVAPVPVRLEIIGTHDAWKLGARDLVDVIARLGKHTHTLTLAVDEPARWQEDLDEVSLNLRHQGASEVRAEAKSRQAPAEGEVDLGDPCKVASGLATTLDRWVVSAVRNGAAEALRTDPWSAVADTLGALSFEVDWFRSTLRTSKSDRAHSIQRLGRRSVAHLVDALLFSKAVSVVLEALEASARPDFPYNLDFSGCVAGEGIGFTYALGAVDSLKADVYLLLLTGSSRTHLVGPRRIGAPPCAPNERIRTAWRIGDQGAHHRILCAFSENARAKLTDGWDDFKAHLIREIRAQNALIDPD